MNDKQRKRLLKVKLVIEEILYEEQDKLDNLPESLQYGKTGEDIEEAMQWLEEARDCLNEVGV
jgi:vacuolar-type H+-ATPase subunit E/Vma4